MTTWSAAATESDGVTQGDTATGVQHDANGTSRPLPRHRWHLRWGGVVTRWFDPLDACRGNGQRSGRLELVVVLDLVDHGRVGVEAWLETPGARRPVLRRGILDGNVSFDGSLCHIDAELPDGERLVVTLDHLQDRLLYAQGSLLDRSGLPVGSFDPPTLERVNGRA